MTTGAGTQHLGMIDGIGRYRFPGHGTRGMTVVTQIRGIDMGRRLSVAGRAGTDYLGMIHPVGCDRPPRGRKFIMAGITHIAAGYVRR